MGVRLKSSWACAAVPALCCAREGKAEFGAVDLAPCSDLSPAGETQSGYSAGIPAFFAAYEPFGRLPRGGAPVVTVACSRKGRHWKPRDLSNAKDGLGS